jgi:diguanylate cyclase (GGDEF)-like protein
MFTGLQTWFNDTFPFVGADLSELHWVLVLLGLGMICYVAVAVRGLWGFGGVWGKPTPTLRLLGGSALACFAVLAGYTYEICNQLLSGTLRGFEFKMTATYAAGALFFLYVMSYTGARDSLSRMVQGMVILGPLAFAALIWTNSMHSLFQFDTHLDCRISFCPLARGGFGPAYVAATTYLAVLAFYGLGRLAVFYPRVSPIYRQQIAALFGVFLIPMSAAVLVSSGAHLGVHQDVPSLSLVPGAFLMAWASWKLKLTRLTPEVWGRAVDRRDDAVLALDREHQVVDANPAAKNLLGTELLGRTLEQIFQGVFPQHTQELYLSERYFEVQLNPLGNPQDPTGYLLVLQEITRLKQSELLLLESYRTLEHKQSELEQLRFEEGLLSQFSARVLTLDTPQALFEAFASSLEQLSPDKWGIALELETPTLQLYAGSPTLLEYSLGDLPKYSLELLGGTEHLGRLTYGVTQRSPVLHELLERLQLGLYTLYLQDTLRQHALHDKLTGLFNRRSLDEQLEQLERAKIPSSLILFDVDRFRDFNANHGYAGGDFVLKAIGTLLALRCKELAVPFRYGGEEFCILLPEVDFEQAQIWTEQLCTEIKNLSLDFSGRSLHVTVSAAVAHTQNGYATLLTSADAALHRAKRNGRNRVEQAIPIPILWGRGWG